MDDAAQVTISELSQSIISIFKIANLLLNRTDLGRKKNEKEKWQNIR